MRSDFSQLVRQARKGDSEAFAKLYSEIYKDLYYYALCNLNNQDDAADAVSDAVIDAFAGIKNLKDENAFGILVCGTGIGMSMAANRVPGIRAALCTTEFHASYARAHNNANIICLGERVTGQGLAASMVDVFLSTAFEGGRHLRRINLFNK